MPITVGQTIPTVTTNSAATSAGSFGTNPAAGSSVLLLLAYFDPGANFTISVTDNAPGAGNTYVQDYASAAFSTNYKVLVFRATNIALPAAGLLTLTVHGGGTADFFNWGALEVKGLGAAPLDKTNSNTGALNPISTGTTGTLSLADEIAVSVWACVGSTSVNTITHPAGWTDVFNDGNGSADLESGGSYQVETTTGALNPSWQTTDTGFGTAGCLVATYKGVSGQSGHLLSSLGVGG